MVKTEGIMKIAMVFLTCMAMLSAAPYFEDGYSAEGKISIVSKMETFMLKG